MLIYILIALVLYYNMPKNNKNNKKRSFKYNISSMRKNINYIQTRWKEIEIEALNRRDFSSFFIEKNNEGWEINEYGLMTYPLITDSKFLLKNCSKCPNTVTVIQEIKNVKDSGYMIIPSGLTEFKNQTNEKELNFLGLNNVENCVYEIRNINSKIRNKIHNNGIILKLMNQSLDSINNSNSELGLVLYLRLY
ncbi:hypothetical protein CPAV1605_1194 [seawater metagenome]|uniref:Uncharacterized protein n=1 Tax=seawater metagenome TaxID=1561972 RepID=A0A5E8CJ66_9ZZZZ